MSKYWLLIICVLFLGCNRLKSNDNKTQTNEAEGFLHYFLVEYPDDESWHPERKNTYTLISYYIPIELKDSGLLEPLMSRPEMIPSEKMIDLPNLERLKLYGDVRSLSFLKDITHIKYLNIVPRNPYFNNINGWYTETLEPLKYLINLEELVFTTDITDRTSLYENYLYALYEKYISAFGNLVKLKKLKLGFEHYVFLLDLEPLRSLVNLEELSLESKSGHDLSFIEDMKKLKILKIDLSETVNIDPVGKLTNLEDIELNIYNGDINIDPVGKLTNLKLLSLYTPDGKFISSSDIFTNLLKLEELTIRTGNNVNLAFIGVLPKLKRLSIYSTYVDISFLKNPELEYLDIDYFYTSIYGYDAYIKDSKWKLDDLKPLLKLPKLEKIRIQSFNDVNIFLPLIESNSIKEIFLRPDYYYDSNFPVKEFEKRGIEILTDGTE